ncbi:NAD(P)/FAD-dependent oxidoreductase [Halopiger xanaduensis]|uniref:FAD dependent oxidoreductase n=1 Tax=Halopiger xanaduensis (strain DSM 18323 / JCM 14033 / SH-6) TaxID=797210 RepID=F8D450_HALXS|nr:FAD-dependent oxidoreductase [Halopiger xanaduensis]AEH37449.1 FAD dependent oxidoreductase [Halopiger xanaduensis SH-6]
MTRIGIVGAGAAAAAAAYALEETLPDATVTVLEKSGGVCGRAATRRRDGVVYDYGANYVKDDDERVTDLLTETLETDGLVDITEPIWTFDRGGDVSEGRDADEHKWTYRAGLTQIAKRLFARTDVDVHRETRVERLVRDAGGAVNGGESAGWRLEDDDGDEWGPFDALLLNPPAPQTADLLRSAEWDADDGLRETLVDAIDDVPYRTIWTAALHYPFELERPYYALVNTDKAHEVGWIAREECKPDHVPGGESLLIVQANHEWSVEHYDDPPAENCEELARIAAALLGDDRLADPDWTDHQGWRYALPEAGAQTGPLRSAEAEGLYCIGDWVAGEGRLHAALRSGLEVGERIALE